MKHMHIAIVLNWNHRSASFILKCSSRYLGDKLKRLFCQLKLPHRFVFLWSSLAQSSITAERCCPFLQVAGCSALPLIVFHFPLPLSFQEVLRDWPTYAASGSAGPWAKLVSNTSRPCRCRCPSTTSCFTRIEPVRRPDPDLLPPNPRQSVLMDSMV